MEDRPSSTFQVDRAAIRTRRKELGMTQVMCATAAGISRSYLAEIEAGHRKHMRPPTYAGLRTALHIQADDMQLLAPAAEPHRKESDGRQECTPRPHPEAAG
jgi:transcriptional regulator with XRE-family HTH domain